MNSEAYERFRSAITRPLAVIDGDDLVLSDGSLAGFRYPLFKLDLQHPLWDLFSQPWFTEQHALAAAPLVRWELDRCAKEESREADRQRGFSG